MNVIPVIQIVLSVLLIVLILMQQNDASLGAAFGGDDSGVARTRRGPEKFVFIATVIIAIAFALSSIAALIY